MLMKSFYSRSILTLMLTQKLRNNQSIPITLLFSYIIIQQYAICLLHTLMYRHLLIHHPQLPDLSTKEWWLYRKAARKNLKISSPEDCNYHLWLEYKHVSKYIKANPGNTSDVLIHAVIFQVNSQGHCHIVLDNINFWTCFFSENRLVKLRSVPITLHSKFAFIWKVFIFSKVFNLKAKQVNIWEKQMI